MALFLNKWGDLRGKVGDVVLSVNKGGAYMRSKVTPLNPQSARQQAARQRLAEFARQYAYNLTPDERESWRSLAQSVPYKNVFGESKKLNALSMFVKVNAMLSACGQTTLTEAPYNLSVRPITVAVVSIPTVALREWSLTITPTISATESLVMYSTAGVRPGIEFVKNLYRFSDVRPGPQTNPVATEVAPEIGSMAIGQTVHSLICRLNNENGAITLGVPISATIVA